MSVKISGSLFASGTLHRQRYEAAAAGPEEGVGGTCLRTGHEAPAGGGRPHALNALTPRPLAARAGASACSKLTAHRYLRDTCYVI